MGVSRRLPDVSRETFGLIGAVAILAAVATVAIVVRYREEISLGAGVSSGD